MRYLLFVSFMGMMYACTPKAYKNLRPVAGQATCIEKFRPSIQRALYQARVDVMGNHLSGILLIKQMPDSSTRLLFTNEAGFSFFDFEFSKDGRFTVRSIIEKMNKKAVKSTLRKDFDLVLMNKLNRETGSVQKAINEYYYSFNEGKDYYYYITGDACEPLIRMERGSKQKKVLVAFRGPLNEGVPDSISIHHNNFNFDINLNRLYDNAE